MKQIYINLSQLIYYIKNNEYLYGYMEEVLYGANEENGYNMDKIKDIRKKLFKNNNILNDLK